MEARSIQPTVLIVDDERFVRELLCDFLRDEGYRILVAENAREALRVMNSEVGVVILDLWMPGIDGLSLCRQILSDPATSSASVLFLTGAGDNRVRDEARSAGAMDFVLKPIRATELRIKVAALAGLIQVAPAARRKAYARLLEVETSREAHDDALLDTRVGSIASPPPGWVPADD